MDGGEREERERERERKKERERERRERGRERERATKFVPSASLKKKKGEREAKTSYAVCGTVSLLLAVCKSSFSERWETNGKIMRLIWVCDKAGRNGGTFF